MEEKIWMNYLLNEVRRDAIRKSQGEKVTEQVYSAIFQILKFVKLARKEGLLALDEEWKKELENGELEPGLDDIAILPMGIEYLCDGIEDDVIVEILTTKYWARNPQGMEALAYYICIQGIIMSRKDLSVYFLEALFTALLPEECIVEYERRKEDRIPEQTSGERLEKFIETEPDLPRRSIIIRNALEEKINQATESAMKASMEKLGSDIAVAVKGLSKISKKKLFSCMSSNRRNIVWEDVEFMGPVRSIDVEDVMVKFLEYLEETGQENTAGKSCVNGDEGNGI